MHRGRACRTVHRAMKTIQLRAGPVTAVVDPNHGGRLASLVIRGRERLITRPDPRADLPAITWGAFPMVPWVGRLRGGHVEWNGASFDVGRNFQGHAIHGTTFDRPWTVVTSDERSARMTCPIGDGDGWPYAADIDHEVEIGDDAIAFRIAVRAATAMPVAVGWHPWFRREDAEPIRVAVPSGQVLETTADLIPTGSTVAVAGPTDLREAVEVGDRTLDHAYVEVSGPSRLSWEDLQLTIHAEPLASVVVHTTPTGVCIEPQTAWPDAIRLDGRGIRTGLVTVPAGETFHAASRWTWRDTGDRLRT